VLPDEYSQKAGASRLVESDPLLVVTCVGDNDVLDRRTSRQGVGHTRAQRCADDDYACA